MIARSGSRRVRGLRRPPPDRPRRAASGRGDRRLLLIVAASTYKPAYDELRVFLLRDGRMKLVLPVYRALASTPSGAALAREVYAAARPGYHPITAAAVEKVLAA